MNEKEKKKKKKSPNPLFYVLKYTRTISLIAHKVMTTYVAKKREESLDFQVEELDFTHNESSA
jgi:hypothetical protein